MDFRLPAMACTPGPRFALAIKRSNSNNGDVVCCLASSKGRGFGPEPTEKKEKSNNTKISKEDVHFSSKPSKLVSGGRKTRTQQASGLTRRDDRNASNAVLDRKFLEKVEAVRRSALGQKKAVENKTSLTIDYEAPIETEQSTVGLGTKVGVGIAVVVFGLVFALGDFLPSGSVAPSENVSTVDKKLTGEEKATLQTTLQQYEETLSKSPKDTTALEGAAVTLADLGEYERSASLLEKLIKERPNYIDAYRLLGEVKYEIKDYDGSASAYKRCLLASESTDFEVLRGLTNSLLAAKKPNEAVQVLLSTRDRLNERNIDVSLDSTDPDNKIQKTDPIQVELLLGKAYSDWGHVSDAITVYDQLISKHPDDFRGYLAKGIILKENGKVGDAERMFIQENYLRNLDHNATYLSLDHENGYTLFLEIVCKQITTDHTGAVTSHT